MKFLKLTLLLLLCTCTQVHAATDTFTERQIPWEQVEREQAFYLAIERQTYTTLDKVGRFVAVLQRGREIAPSSKAQVQWTVRRDGNTFKQSTSSIDEGMLCVDFDVTALANTRYDVEANLLIDGIETATDSDYFVIEKAEQPASQGRFGIFLPRGIPATAQGWPMQFGIPMPKGALVNSEQIRVVDEQGNLLPSSKTVRTRWGYSEDSSLRWVGVDVQLPETLATNHEDPAPKYFVEFGKQDTNKHANIVKVNDFPTGIKVNTGPLEFTVSRRAFNLFDQVRINGRMIAKGKRDGGAYLVDQEGNTYRAANDRDVSVTVEEQNDMRVVLRCEGWFVRDGSKGETTNFTLPTDRLCKFVTRIEAYAGQSHVRVLHTYVVTYDSFNVQLADIGLSLPLNNATQASFGIVGEKDSKHPVSRDGVYLIQHLADQFAIESSDGQLLHKGTHADGSVIATHSAGRVGVAIRDMWRRYPNELEVTDDSLTVHLWPEHGRDHPEINIFARDRLHQQMYTHQGKLMDLSVPWDALFAYAKWVDREGFGAYKPLGNIMSGVHSSAMGVAQTADLLITFATPDDESDDIEKKLDAHLAQLHALADPSWLSETKAMGYVHPYDPARFPAHEKTLANYQKGYWRVQEATGIFGKWLYRAWHHNKYLGDNQWELYRIYSAGHHGEPYMPWLLYARSGDPEYLTMATATSRSFADFMILHHDEPDYEHQEFISRQGRLVGSTKHTNGHILWGGDHAVFGHLTTYRALTTAYYLTGDLRFKQVLVEEWEKTITEDRANPEFTRANRIQNLGRDNNNALAELIDLYQMTYNPALLGWIGPATDRFNKEMKVWGFPQESVLTFSGNHQTKQQILEAAALYREKHTRPTEYGAFIGHSHEGVFALAHLLDPSQSFASEAYIHSGPNLHIAKAEDCFSMTPGMITYCTIPDYVLYIPRVLYAVASSGMADTMTTASVTQPMPIAPDWIDHGYLRIVVREDEDQTIDLKFIGKIGEDGVKVQVHSPKGEVVLTDHLEPSVGGKIRTIPKDGITGEYVIFLNMQDNKDQLTAPLTDLPEVYHTWYFSQPFFTRFFTMAGNLEGNRLAVLASKGTSAIYDRSRQKLLDYSKPPESRMVSHEVPEDGVWFDLKGRYVHMGDKQPLVFAVSPERYFVPSEQSLSVRPSLK